MHEQFTDYEKNPLKHHPEYPVSSVRLLWVTPDPEVAIAWMARGSNPAGQSNVEYKKLFTSFFKRKEWSPFEMANMCVEMYAPRDITRQVLRHKSMNFQEASQRYMDVTDIEKVPAAQLTPFVLRECRKKHPTDRQKSIPLDPEDSSLLVNWNLTVEQLTGVIQDVYKRFLSDGVAKEVARVLLPEGLTMTRLIVNGTVRSWIHYFMVRATVLDINMMNVDSLNGTQREHMALANMCFHLFKKEFPVIAQLIEEKEGGTL